MFDLSPDEARLLLNVAMMAVGQNSFKSADKILTALEQYRPDDVALITTRAVMLISMQEFQKAVDYIDRVGLPKHPDAAMLQAFKGMALLRMNLQNAARQPLEAAANSSDSAAAKLAKDLLS
ncbi:MAG: hypothetical protein MJ106_00795 [Lentisphaeria bacterium]|nr:hypothetical protein [Lentisphaeria bacterium]